MLICKEWSAVGFQWRLLRDRRLGWYYLERDGVIIAEDRDRQTLLARGWYN